MTAKFSSRNWRNLGEPDCQNQADWQWSRLQREWTAEPHLLIAIYRPIVLNDGESAILRVLSGR